MGHLLFTDIEEGTYQIEQLQITNPEVIPHGIRCEGLLRVLSWVSFDHPDHYKRTLSMLLQATGEGCNSLHTVPIEGRDIRDDQIAMSRACSRYGSMVTTPGMGIWKEEVLFVLCLLSSCVGFPYALSSSSWTWSVTIWLKPLGSRLYRLKPRGTG